MKEDYREEWWNRDAQPEEEDMTVKDLVIGLIFCAVIMAVSMVSFWVKGVYF